MTFTELVDRVRRHIQGVTVDHTAVQLGSGSANGTHFLRGDLAWKVPQSKGADIASAATLNIGTSDGYFAVTGTTTVTAISARDPGAVIALRFDGALTLTHNATSLILQGGVNLTTAAGDVLTLVSEGSGNWRELSRRLADGDYGLSKSRWEFKLNASDSVATAVDGSGAVNNPEAAYTGNIQLATGATSASNAGLMRKAFGNNNGMTGVWKLRLFSALVNISSFLDDDARVFMTNDAVAATAPSLTARHIGIKVAGGVASFSTADGTTEQTTDITASFTANSTHVLAFTFDGTTAKCYVNGTLVATHTTNVPTTQADTEPQFRAHITNSVASGRDIRIGWVSAIFDAR